MYLSRMLTLFSSVQLSVLSDNVLCMCCALLMKTLILVLVRLGSPLVCLS